MYYINHNIRHNIFFQLKCNKTTVLISRRVSLKTQDKYWFNHVLVFGDALPNWSPACNFKTEKIIHAVVSSRLDYCNALLKGLRQVSMAHFLFIQTVAHLLTSNVSSTFVTLYTDYEWNHSSTLKLFKLHLSWSWLNCMSELLCSSNTVNNLASQTPKAYSFGHYTMNWGWRVTVLSIHCNWLTFKKA